MIVLVKYFQLMSPPELHFEHSENQLRQNIFTKLLNLSTEVMFIQNGQLFSQIDGVTMGVPL